MPPFSPKTKFIIKRIIIFAIIWLFGKSIIDLIQGDCLENSIGSDEILVNLFIGAVVGLFNGIVQWNINRKSTNQESK